MMGTNREVSAQKRAEEALIAANLAKSDVLATMSHEIGTPETNRAGVLEAELAIFDEADFLNRTMADPKLERALVAVFLRDLPLHLAAISAAIKSGDCDDAMRQAHRLKGAAANLSAERLRETALSVETAGKAGDLDAVTALMPELRLEAAELERTLAALCEIEGEKPRGSLA